MQKLPGLLYAQSFPSPGPFLLILHLKHCKYRQDPISSGVSFSKYQGLNLLIAFLVALVECKESHWQTTFTIHVQEQFLHHVLRSPRRCFGDRCQSQWSPAEKKKPRPCCGTFPGLPRKILNNTDLLTNIFRVPPFGSSVFFPPKKTMFFRSCSFQVNVSNPERGHVPQFQSAWCCTWNP